MVGQCRTSGEMSHGKKEEAENEDKGILKVFLSFYQAAATTELPLKLDNVRSVYSGTHRHTLKKIFFFSVAKQEKNTADTTDGRRLASLFHFFLVILFGEQNCLSRSSSATRASCGGSFTGVCVCLAPRDQIETAGATATTATATAAGTHIQHTSTLNRRR